uniref:Uncharacterized protein n=1 Tax=Oryza sativa subsp. japonica TaxID=39947 RepID=Q6Z4L6_ORYSJ|nr:hypothetical protein [Oryza sativa Japonica Group]
MLFAAASQASVALAANASVASRTAAAHARHSHADLLPFKIYPRKIFYSHILLYCNKFIFDLLLIWKKR